MRTYGGIQVYFHEFLTWVLGEGEWSASRLCLLTTGILCIGEWAGLRVGLDTVAKIKIHTLLGVEPPVLQS
jgi:hypothetical protein